MPDSNDNPDAAYYAAMAAEDAFGVVIRAGAYIDHELIKLLEATVPAPKALKQVPLDYAGRCALAVALGLDERFQSPLSALGKIRNRLAHRPEASLSEEDAKNLYKALAGPERTMVQDNFAKTLQNRGQKARRFGDEPALDRFVMIAIVLRSALVVARTHVEHVRPMTPPRGRDDS
ncbi:hypothetical protein [Mesorhizobium sp.]|uniref:hypothetical protein n=1 Tax=Mesorhizobium sp. TaxID=1871066 RepID=UPI00120D69F6|nr:hypothetical protein [Mesorhizobium sp.]TIL50466.1 MAG: hypothetical protein E5Y83_21845 [Mesorhizobium sp.]